MDEFYRNIYGLLIFEWLKKLTFQYKLPSFDYELSDTCYVATIDYEGFHGVVTLWLNDKIMEEEIIDSHNKSLFYLHYDVISLKHCFYFIHDFFRALTNFIDLSKTKILLCCSGGLSTSMFADSLQSIADSYHYPMNFYATSVYQVDTMIQDYDILLLAPQVAYMEAHLLQLASHHQLVMCIHPKDFATQNFHQLVFQIANINIARNSL